jgi:ATP-dependent RNA helicase DeaD
MIRQAKLDIRRERVPSIDQVEEARENQFFEKLRATLGAANFKKQDRMLDRLLEQGYASTDIAAALIHMLQGGAPEGPAKAVPSSKKTEERFPETARREPSTQPHPKKAKTAPSFAPSYPGTEKTKERKPKAKFQRDGRTGNERGFVTLYCNVGRKHLITPADLVGKIAGVMRLPADVVGAIDVHQRHCLVDVAEPVAHRIVAKMTGIKIKGHELAVSMADTA